MEELSFSAYDDFLDDVKVKKDGEGLFSPFTFLCFALILFLFGLLCLFSASMNKALREGLPFNHYFFNQLFGALVGGFLGVIAIFTPKRIISKIHFITLPLSAIMMVLTIVRDDLSWMKCISGALFCFSICFFASWAVSFVNKRERKGFALLLIMPLSFLLLALTGYASGLGWFILSLIIILSSASSYRISKGYLFFIALTGIFILFFLISFSSVTFSSFTKAIFPVADSSMYESDLLASSMAIMDGGVKGIGLGQGLYKLGLISDPTGEYIFATVFEESGIFGLILILFPLIMILIVGIRTVNRAERKGDVIFAQMAMSLTAFFVFPFVLNILYVIGINPFEGVFLPLFSYSPALEGIYVFALVLLYRIIHKIGRKKDEEE